MSVAARRMALRSLLGERVVGSQAELVDLLEERGHPVAQSTVSRDLVAIGARKVALNNGAARYVVGESITVDKATLSSTLTRYVLGVIPSGNLVVLHTMPAAANVVASSIDGSGLEGVVGTIAGSDTVLIVVDDASSAPEVGGRIAQVARPERAS